MWHELFEQLERPPSSLTQGDIPANVSTLVAGELPATDEISRRVYQTAKVWLTEVAVARGLETATDLSGNVNLVEQVHASGSVTLQQRQQLGERQM